MFYHIYYFTVFSLHRLVWLSFHSQTVTPRPLLKLSAHKPWRVTNQTSRE